MDRDASFEMAVPSTIPSGQTLLVGLSNLGLGGLTAVDYLVRQLESEEIGHVSPDVLPAISPFQDGVPRHHTRLFDLADHDLVVLVGELFVPIPAAGSFADALYEWIRAESVGEIAVLHGVPYPHEAEEHDVFYVATEPYRAERLESTDVQPLPGGFLDGVAGDLVSRSLEDESPPTGVYVTPTHPPGPDIEAAFRFLDAVETVYGVSVDRTELEERSAEIQRYYTELADRLASLEENEQSIGSRDFPEDRMYM